MATPHVAGGAALVWSHHPFLSNDDVRAGLAASAKDLGPPGADVAYGHGLIQVAAAHALLTAGPGCAANGDCDDGNVCNGAEACSGGTCTAGVKVPAGVACADDGNICNGAEACDGLGACLSDGPVECPAGQACDPVLACIDAPSCKPTGAKCKGSSECCSGACYVGRKGGPQCG
jgi:hypothetical protein